VNQAGLSGLMLFAPAGGCIRHTMQDDACLQPLAHGMRQMCLLQHMSSQHIIIIIIIITGTQLTAHHKTTFVSSITSLCIGG
jgi:hypothetical protein